MFDNNTGHAIHGGNFYNVRGDVNLGDFQTRRNLTNQNRSAVSPTPRPEEGRGGRSPRWETMRLDVPAAGSEREGSGVVRSIHPARQGPYDRRYRSRISLNHVNKPLSSSAMRHSTGDLVKPWRGSIHPARPGPYDRQYQSRIVLNLDNKPLSSSVMRHSADLLKLWRGSKHSARPRPYDHRFRSRISLNNANEPLSSSVLRHSAGDLLKPFHDNADFDSPPSTSSSATLYAEPFESRYFLGRTFFTAANVNFYGTRKRRREELNDDESSAAPSATVEKRRRLEKDYGIKIISDRNLKLIREIRSRPGYCLHAGQNEGRAVTVKVFNPGHGPAVRQQLESTADLSKRIMHPNILRLEGVSSPESSFHFIVYEDVHWKSAEGPLAEALKSDLTRSVTLGFKMVAGLSAGMNHLCSQGVSLRSMRVDNFDIFLDVDDRFIINIHPCQQVDDNPESQEPEATWNVFNALCRKILTSANCVLHEEQITRNPEILDVVHASSIPENSPAASLLSFEPQPTSIQAEEDVTVPPRREYVWRTMDRGQQSLGTVASQLTLELDMKLRLARLPRLARSDSENPHRCVGYAREEITLTTTTLHSAVVAHDTPSPLEICSVCHEVVGHDDAFQCVCGDPDPGSRSTIRCRMCKLWSHSDCVGNVKKDFTCQLCLSPEASRLQPQDGRISQDATPTQPGPQPSTPDSDPIIFNFDDSYLSIDSISFGLQSPNMEVYSWPSQSDYPTWPSLYSRAQSDYPTRSSLQLFAELRARIDFFQKMLISA